MRDEQTIMQLRTNYRNFKCVCKGEETETVGHTKHKGSGCSGVKRWRKSEHNILRATRKHLTTILRVVQHLKEVQKISEKLAPRVCWLAFHAVLKKEKCWTQIWCMVLFPLTFAVVRCFTVSALPRVTTSSWGFQRNCFARHQSLF